MKTIHLIIISICFLIGCKSIEKDDSGLVRTQREEPKSFGDGKKDIIEYHRNGKLILQILKHHKKDSAHIWQIVQTVYYNGNKVLLIRDMDFSDPSSLGSKKTKKQLTDDRNLTFSSFHYPDAEVNIVLDKATGSCKYISIFNPKTFFVYDAFEFKNELIIPFSDLELRKSNAAWDAVTDIMGDLPEAIKTQKIDKDKLVDQLIKHKEKIEEMK
jgi:hypothetical protein